MTTALPGTGAPARFNIARYCLEANAHTRPDEIALSILGQGGVVLRQWSFAGFWDDTCRLGAALRTLDLPAGARIAIRQDNSGAFALAFFATIAAGYVAVPTSEQLTRAEIGALVMDCGASVLLSSAALAVGAGLPTGCREIAGSAFEALAKSAAPAPPVDTATDDPAFLVYTSGTSGRPKGVLHGQRAAWGRRPMIAGWTGLEPGDRVLHAGRLNWTYSMGVGLIDPWSLGAGSLLYDGPRDSSVWPSLIDSHNVTIFVAVPVVYRQMLKYCAMETHDLSSLRHAITAGEPLRPELLDAWRTATGTELYEALGMSEISTYVSSGPATPIHPGSPGRAQPGRKIAILSVDGGTEPLGLGKRGLLAVHRSDPGLMLGYWPPGSQDESCFRGEWFVGGDLAELDAEGYVWFHGRDDEVMNALGYRVSPLEIEAVLSAHPDIADVAVGELQVRDDVSVIAAFIVPRVPGGLSEHAVRAWCETRLADYKRPREIRMVIELPRTATGKLLRRRLAKGEPA